MKMICIVLLSVEVALFIAEIITMIVGGLDIGFLGYPDTWESKKCEKVYNFLAVVSIIIIPILIVSTIILVIGR